MHTDCDPAPHNHNQHRTPYSVVHDLDLLMMGIMIPETCWNRSLIINIWLVASCWFLSLHPTFMRHGHKSLKLSTLYIILQFRLIIYTKWLWLCNDCKICTVKWHFILSLIFQQPVISTNQSVVEASTPRIPHTNALPSPYLITRTLCLIYNLLAWWWDLSIRHTQTIYSLLEHLQNRWWPPSRPKHVVSLTSNKTSCVLTYFTFAFIFISTNQGGRL